MRITVKHLMKRFEKYDPDALVCVGDSRIGYRGFFNTKQTETKDGEKVLLIKILNDKEVQNEIDKRFMFFDDQPGIYVCEAYNMYCINADKDGKCTDRDKTLECER